MAVMARDIASRSLRVSAPKRIIEGQGASVSGQGQDAESPPYAFP